MRALLFDLYGVIMNIQSDSTLAAIEDTAGVEAERFWAAYWAERHDYDAGNVDGMQYWLRVGKRLNHLFPNIDALINVDIAGWLNPKDDMVAYIHQLSASGIPIGLLSNIPRELSEKMLNSFAWLKLFDPLVLSCRTGFAKPQHEIFTLALQSFGQQPDNVLFIDDSPRNIEAAREYGLATHLFTDRESLRPVIDAHLRGTTNHESSW